MQRIFSFALLIATFVCFALAGPAASRGSLPDGFEAERQAAVKELISGLSAYADWSSSKKLWLERNRALEAILAIDPGNLAAKRGLGWLQVADGVWEPAKDVKPAKNYEPASLKEAPARFADAIKPWRDHLVQLLEAHKSELTFAQKESVYEEILTIDPEDAFVHEARGEAHGDKGWVLADTLRAKTRRGEIKQIVKQALTDAPHAADFVPNTNDMAAKIDWKVSISTPRIRVLSTGERAEAVRVAQVLHAAEDVFQKVFDTTTELPPETTVYLLCDPGSKAAFIESLGGSSSQRGFYQAIDGTGLIGTSAAWWSQSPERRLDGLTRHVLGALFQAEFHLTVEVPWAWEGFGLYLTRELIGSRFTWYIIPIADNASSAAKRVGPDWMKKLLTPGTNWMNEGYHLVRNGNGTDLVATLTRPLNKMTPQDLFVSYVVAAYLLEAQAKPLPAIMRLLGGTNGKAGQKTTAVFESQLAMDMENFRAKLERWLGERR